MAAGGRRRKGVLGLVPWRGLFVLAVLVTVFRVFFCNVLRVPSGSMEPTLHGDPTRGDELLVVKPWYRIWDPERFDLAVFERHGDDVKTEERVAVKRVVALGGETVRVDRGDLYIAEKNGAEKRLEKSRREFKELLVPLWIEPFDEMTSERLLAQDDSGTTYGRDGIVLMSATEESGLLQLASDAVRFDDGWLDRRGVVHEGENAVKDVCFVLGFEPIDASVCIAFEFTSGGDQLRYLIVPRAPGHALEVTRTTVSDGAEFPDSTRFRQISPGKAHDLEFWQIDGRVGFAVDGRVELDVVLPGGAKVVSAGYDVRDVSLRVYHGSARITKFEAWRDLHWDSDDGTFGVREPFEVPEGTCFVLGDSSFQSVDSRHFGAVPLADLVGLPLLIVGPTGRRRLLH